MKKILSLLVITLYLSSCGLSFDEASFKRISDGDIIEVDQQSLEAYEPGQKVWLIRSYSSGGSDSWEILDDFTSGQIGFWPTQDTTFIFKSQGGAYKREIARAVLVKKL